MQSEASLSCVQIDECGIVKERIIEMASRLFEKHCCGLPLRNACIFTGFLEVILSAAMFCAALDALPPWILVPAITIDILVTISMVIGAIRRQSFLFWPYVVEKIIVVVGSAIMFGLCVLLVTYAQWTRYVLEYNLSHAIMTAIGFCFGILFLILFILNLIPILIVRNYHRELLKREDQGIDMTAAYDCLSEPNEQPAK